MQIALRPLGCDVIGSTDTKNSLHFIDKVIAQYKPTNSPKAKASEPKAILLDFAESGSASIEIMRQLKSRQDTSYIPLIPIVEDESLLLPEVHSMVASFAHIPIGEDVIASVFMTGFRLSGSVNGWQLPVVGGTTVLREIDALLRTVFGAGGAYRRMMTQIANAEKRPTVAFEFKLVPIAPYDFFFLDYEWSGSKSDYHCFDWLLNF